MKDYTEEEQKQIQDLGGYLCGKYGWKDDYSFQKEDDGTYTGRIRFQARDVDGDWGHAASVHWKLTWEQILDEIKDPYKYYNTDSWN